MVLIVAALSFLTACGQDYEDVKAESIEAFKTIIDASIAKSDDDLARLDKELFQNKERQIKVQYVVGPAIEWADEQKKEMEAKLAGTWLRRLDQSWMSDKFTSDLYQVTEVTVLGSEMGSQREEITYKIIVKDLTTGASGEWQSVLANLEEQQAVFEQRRQTFMEKARQVVSTFDNVIQHYEEWQVTKINDTTFQISGPGLGIPSEGSWVFYRDKGEIVAADGPAKSLEKVLEMK